MTIQPQFIIWPLVAIVLIIATILLLVWVFTSSKRQKAKYETDKARIDKDFNEWSTKRDAARNEFERKQKTLPDHMRDYWSEWEYEEKNPRPERDPKRPEDPTDRWQFLFGMATGVLALIAIIVNIVILAPYDGKFYTFEPVHGTVSRTVNFTQTTDSKYVYTNYVFEVDGVKGPLLTDDDRAIAFKVGQEVNLTCHWSFVPFGSPKHECIIN